MSTNEEQPPAQPPSQPPNDEKKAENPAPATEASATEQDSNAMDVQPEQPAEDNFDDIPAEIMESGTDDILTRVRLLENDIKVMRSETLRLQHEQNTMQEKIRENKEKVKQNKVLPYLVGNVVEVSYGHTKGFASEHV